MKRFRNYLLFLLAFYFVFRCVSSENLEETSPPQDTTITIPSEDRDVDFMKVDLSCMGDNFNINDFLYQDVAKKLEAQKLLYDGQNPAKLQDCSGIFHRVLKIVSQKTKANCNYVFPSLQQRSSKSLAAWYHKNKNFIFIDSPSESGHLIKEGTVVFYGQQNKQYKQTNIQELTGTKGIQHIGVVVKVERDRNGKVLNYGLFHGHGRTGIQAADITYFHRWKDNHLAYSNGNQQIVGIANLFTAK